MRVWCFFLMAKHIDLARAQNRTFQTRVLFDPESRSHPWMYTAEIPFDIG